MIFSVGQLTEEVKQRLESAFPYIWVRGEVTDVARPASGHLYFSLKEQQALLRCVWFKGQQKEQDAFDPLTGEVYEDGAKVSLAKTLRNGQQVVCAGRLAVYAPSGSYQLVVELAQDSGEGQLHLALEALRRQLDAQGYFRIERKRPLPSHPERIALITAPRGAAIRDFLRLAQERGTGAHIRLYPVPVQGEDAPPRIADAIRHAAASGWAEVIVVIRGGGSLQDLWAFNDIRVAEAIFNASLPVLAGIGHEVDTSLADMTADLRAATPSHAAQLLWPERTWYAQRLDDLERQLKIGHNRVLQRQDARLQHLLQRLHWLAPQNRLERLQERLSALCARLHRSRTSGLDTIAMRLEWLTTRLESLDPERPLQRGYALILTQDGEVVRRVSHVDAPNQALTVKLHDGTLDVRVHAIHKEAS